MLLLLLLAFPCALISIGESYSSFEADGSSRLLSSEKVKQVMRLTHILTWQSHAEVHKQLQVFTSALVTSMYRHFIGTFIHINNSGVSGVF